MSKNLQSEEITTPGKMAVNLSSEELSGTASAAKVEALNLGLKFIPKRTKDTTPDLAPRIKNTVKSLTEYIS